MQLTLSPLSGIPIVKPGDDLFLLITSALEQTKIDPGLLEILVSAGGTWTILVTDGNRTSCVIAVGEDWESVWAASAEFGA